MTKKNQSRFVPIRDFYKEEFNFILPKNISTMMVRDSRSVLFNLSRHKFVAKMLKDKRNILDVGCGEGFGTGFVSGMNNNQKCTGIDRIDDNISEANSKIKKYYSNTKFLSKDIFKKPKIGKFDGIYSLDMLEHVNKKKEHLYFKNIKNLMKKSAIFIVGMPSIESQKYASIQNKKQHINCKNLYELKKTCDTYFKFTLPFSMNDEVVHTGYDKMSQYIFVVCSD